MIGRGGVMTDEEIFNDTLAELSKRFPHGINLKTYIPIRFQIKGKDRLRVIDLMERKGLIEVSQEDSDKHVITIQGRNLIDEYGSYSRSKTNQTKKAKKDKIKMVLTIASPIIFGVSTMILGWMNYLDNQTIKDLESENQKLIHQLDSLENENSILKYYLDIEAETDSLSNPE